MAARSSTAGQSQEWELVGYRARSHRVGLTEAMQQQQQQQQLTMSVSWGLFLKRHSVSPIYESALCGLHTEFYYYSFIV